MAVQRGPGWVWAAASAWLQALLSPHAVAQGEARAVVAVDVFAARAAVAMMTRTMRHTCLQAAALSESLHAVAVAAADVV